MYFYCPKCGRIIFGFNESHKCDCCKTAMLPVPTKYWEDDDGIELSKKNSQRVEEFREKYVKTSPEFDQYLFDHRDEIQAEKQAKYDFDMKVGTAIQNGADPQIALKTGGENLPKCPTCGSIKVKPIGAGERGASIFMFGLFSRKINKSFKCENCGYMW